MALQRYRRRSDTPVTAVQLRLETTGFTYTKWGGPQVCRAGDWLVDNNGEVYTVDQETFEQTYKAVGPGQYRKAAPVWAEIADQAGEIDTKEGQTHYEAGDYLVYNDADRRDGYAMPAARFEQLYEAS